MLKIKRAAVTAVLLIAAVALVSSASAKPKATTLVVGAIHVGSITDAGYNQAQHDGLVYLQKHVPGIQLIEASNIPESPQVETVMQGMISQGAKLIFPQSFGYQDFALNVAAKNPSIYFEHPAGYKSAANFGTYWAASTPMNYALGAAAAKVSKTGKLGFVGAMPIPTVIATADAFHLGALSVNPKIKTVVVFTGSWSDPAKEAAAVNTMVNQHVDVVAGLVDSPITLVKTAEARGVWAVGYHSAAAAKYAPKHWLSGVDFNWGPMFVQMAKQVIAGTWEAQNTIAPVGAGVARLAPFGKNVPSSAQKLARDIVKRFAAGQQTSVFRGPVYDQSGKLQVKKGVQPNPQFEQNVTWLVKGMIGSPK
jgi:basic membrane protein A and related proteins